MIDLEEHVVASSYNPLTNTCLYVVAWEGRRYTVKIPKHELDKHGLSNGHEARRRDHLLMAIAARLKLPPDPEPEEP